jgi:HTH-type transcriptional regulator/antitoxin MqsA
MERSCIACDSANGMISFSNETMTIRYENRSMAVSALSGWRCADCGEVEFDDESARRYAAAGDELVMQARRETGAELRRIRKKLGLNQSEAAKLTGGGHNAFSRYENGLVVPAPAVINLFKLLEKHPEELEKLAG